MNPGQSAKSRAQLTTNRTLRARSIQAFSLMEVVVAMITVGIMVTALYAGLLWCTTSVRNARENLRASEVLVEKMEVIRLLTWDQIGDTNVLPTYFTAPYVTTIVVSNTKTNSGSSSGSGGTTNVSSAGFSYYGTITVLPPLGTQLPVIYTNDLLVVHVQVFWTNQGLSHTRSINSYVSRYGIQNYAIN